MHSVPEGLGLPTMFINHLDENGESALIKFTNDRMLSRGVNSRKDGFIREALILISSSS